MQWRVVAEGEPISVHVEGGYTSKPAPSAGVIFKETVREPNGSLVSESDWLFVPLETLVVATQQAKKRVRR